MGKKPEAIRVVLDTNVLVSALLFGGPPDKLLRLWKEGRVVLLLSKEVLLEYLHVLGYQKFELDQEEIKGLIEECVLPFAEMVKVDDSPIVIREDPADDKFLALAEAGHAGFILSGDRHLLSLREYQGIQIITAREFLEKN